MRIAIVGPASPAALADLLPASSAQMAGACAGLGGTPVNILVRELVRRGHHVTVITLDRFLHAPLQMSGPELEIRVGPFRTSARARVLDLFMKERMFVTHAVSQTQCDLVHAHWTYEFALGALATKKRVVITVHDAPWRILWLTRSLYRLVRLGMAYGALGLARELICVSPYIAHHIRSYFPYRGQMSIIPNGLPSEIFADRPGHRLGNVSFGMILSGFDRLRNARSAMLAFGHVRRVLPEARLLMFGGDFGEGGPASTWGKEVGLGDGMFFRGALRHDQLIRSLRDDVDVLVHPSLEESHSMAITEAMSQGKAVIGGCYSGAVPWVLAQGEAGLLVDVREPAAIANAMVQLGTDFQLREDLSHRALANARSRFDIRHVAQLHEQVYLRR